MNISTCWAYENIELNLNVEGKNIYIGLSCPNADAYINLTLDREQARKMAESITELLLKLDKQEAIINNRRKVTLEQRKVA